MRRVLVEDAGSRALRDHAVVVICQDVQSALEVHDSPVRM